MEPIRIYPEYALILTYDIKSGVQDRYFRWVTQELVPSLQRRKIYMQNAWHIIYPNDMASDDETPHRQIEFITEELSALQRLHKDPEWEEMKTRLKTYAENLKIRVVKYTGSFKL